MGYRGGRQAETIPFAGVGKVMWSGSAAGDGKISGVVSGVGVGSVPTATGVSASVDVGARTSVGEGV